MDDHERMQILAEILEERMPYIQHVLDEWSVSEGDALNYAQAKDLIWHLVAPLGITLIGYRAAERALDDGPGHADAQQARELFTSVGQRVGEVLDDALHTAHAVRH